MIKVIKVFFSGFLKLTQMGRGKTLFNPKSSLLFLGIKDDQS